MPPHGGLHLPTRPTQPQRTAPRALVVPDSFKGTFSAAEISELLVRGLAQAGVKTISAPLGDGGEGTAAAVQAALGGSFERFAVTGLMPNTRVLGSVLFLPDRGRAIIDTASASGLPLAPDARDPWAATSRGTGELVVEAVRQGVREVWLGVGGSGCTDGGRGAVEAILDGGGLGNATLKVLCDVRTVYDEAPRTFGPQKGADPAVVAALERRLDDYASSLPRDPRGIPGSGAAGGLAGGLWAQFGATLSSGIEEIIKLLALRDKLSEVDLVVTGEGQLDQQTAQGKVIAGVLAMCAGAVPVHAVVGRTRLTRTEAHDLGLDSVQVASTAAQITCAGRRILSHTRKGQRRRTGWAS